jgi:hypothetical protein
MAITTQYRLEAMESGSFIVVIYYQRTGLGAHNQYRISVLPKNDSVGWKRETDEEEAR